MKNDRYPLYCSIDKKGIFMKYRYENKNRTKNWLQRLRLQLPSGVTNFGSIDILTHTNKDINGKFYFDQEENGYMRDVFRKVEEKNFRYIRSFFYLFCSILLLYIYKILHIIIVER